MWLRMNNQFGQPKSCDVHMITMCKLKLLSCDASLSTCLKRSLVPEIPISWYLSESIKYIVCPVNQCISDNSDGFLYPKNKNSSHSTNTFIYIYPTSQIHEAPKKPFESRLSGVPSGVVPVIPPFLPFSCSQHP